MIESITRAEFDAVPRAARGGARLASPETQALQALAVGTAIKFPCRWKHSTPRNCNSRAGFHLAAKRVGHKIILRCYQGTVYAVRIA